MNKENKILLFGDSITKDYAKYFKEQILEEYPEQNFEIINRGIGGETSRDALKRLDELLSLKPDIVIVGFGMNDWREKCGEKYGVGKTEYKKNIITIVESFEAIGARVILNTLSPSYSFKDEKYNVQTEEYSKIIRDIAYQTKIKIVDIEHFWSEEFKDKKDGLRDDLHPNQRGYKIISKYLTLIVPRKYTTLLWQYNGREAKCNYRCHYCYYIGLHNPQDRFTGYVKQWHERIKESFGNKDLIFYLAFGEPTIGKDFPDIVKMIESEERWQLRLTSNVTAHLDMLSNSILAKENRLFINASFHPCEIEIDEFMKNIILLRDGGIDVSVVYVAHPTYLKRFESDIKEFSKNGFVVHFRRFQGKYQNQFYPWSYTDEERRSIARYMDDASIKGMLNQQVNTGDISFAGFDFFIMDNAGNVGYDSNVFAPYTKYRSIFGNIHTGNFKPILHPSKYPGEFEGTVDGVANLLDTNYKQLVGNNIISFAQQGGVYKNNDGDIVYKNLNKDFTDKQIRKEYNFEDN